MLKWMIAGLLVSTPALAETDAEITERVARYQVEQRAFAAHIRTCTPFEQAFRTSGTTAQRSVEGRQGEICEVRMAALTAGPSDVVCRLSADDAEAFAGGFHAMSDNILRSGAFAQTWPDDTHPLVREIIAGPACRVVTR